jgi:hypothetical protein
MKLWIMMTVACLAGLALAGCTPNAVDSKAVKTGQPSAASAAPVSNDVAPPHDGVVVYYMHRTFRCSTCLKIEKMSHEVVQDAFAAELSSGRVQWQTLNYQEHEPLAERYGVTTSSLVLVSYRGGQEASHQVLEETWSLYRKPAEFQQYVVGAVRERLGSVR